MTGLALRHGPDAVHVVIPAHDEQELLPACLTSVHRAVERLRRLQPAIDVAVTVVADRCSDDTVRIASGRADTTVLEVFAGVVGAARRVGVAHLVDRTSAIDPARVWVASTDADTVVPEHWLVAQLMLAQFGFAMVVGSVRPAADDLTPAVLRAWHALHLLVEGHPHVHGANLGVRLDAYLRAGGFPPAAEHEDVRLVAAVKRAGYRWCATATTTVTTSGRTRARTPGGFAGYLAALDDAAC